MSDPGQTNVLLRHLGAAQRGEPTARETLLGELHLPVLRYLRRKASDEPDAPDVAEDVAQETLIRVAIHLADCRAESDTELLSWTLTIARNAWMDYRRSRRAGFFRLRPSDEVSVARNEPTPRSWADRILGRLLRASLSTLPDETVRILRLHGAEDASWAEVAAALGIPPTAAKRRFQRALVRVRRELLRRIEALPPAQRSAVLRRLPRDSL
jgi:RNA polymerase sigma-70 factor (ECF subfamily)